jgi:hypothetical protein
MASAVVKKKIRIKRKSKSKNTIKRRIRRKRRMAAPGAWCQ